MNRTSKSLRWTRRTIEQAISLSRLIQITRAARDVELRSPAKQCPGCGELVELVVIPGGKCGRLIFLLTQFSLTAGANHLYEFVEEALQVARLRIHLLRS